MSSRAKRLDRMRNNPQDNWTIADLETIANGIDGLEVNAPSGGGSHYAVTHPDAEDILTVPARRPVKTIYIKRFIALIDALHQED